MTWMIADSAKLRGTLYIEILPGAYTNACWGPDSVFFAEEHFAFIEPTIIRNWPTHDHYAFSNIPASTWKQIRKDLDAMSAIIESGGRFDALAGFIYPQRKMKGEDAESTLLTELRSSICDFNAWLATTLLSHDTIAVLGI